MWNCDTGMSPTVLPVVSYRDVRPWQRGGAKLPAVHQVAEQAGEPIAPPFRQLGGVLVAGLLGGVLLLFIAA